MSHDPNYIGSSTLVMQEFIESILRPKPLSEQNTTLVRPHFTSSMYRLNDRPGSWSRGDVHGGIDFNYRGGQGPLNIDGANPVYAPVTGTVIGLQPANHIVGNVVSSSVGGVVIRSDLDGTLHRIIHMHRINVSTSSAINTEIGRASCRERV